MSLVDIRSATITEKGQIAIPRDMRKLGGFKVGSKIAILAYNDRIELRPVKQVSERMEAAMASERSLGKDWNKEDAAWKKL
jgi:AbrB family looped-hinge helix DNA binding protein